MNSAGKEAYYFASGFFESGNRGGESVVSAPVEQEGVSVLIESEPLPRLAQGWLQYE